MCAFSGGWGPYRFLAIVLQNSDVDYHTFKFNFFSFPLTSPISYTACNDACQFAVKELLDIKLLNNHCMDNYVYLYNCHIV